MLRPDKILVGLIVHSLQLLHEDGLTVEIVLQCHQRVHLLILVLQIVRLLLLVAVVFLMSLRVCLLVVVHECFLTAESNG